MKNGQVGNYRLVRVLSLGGFGTEYLGEHIDSGDRVYIKVWQTRSELLIKDLLAETRLLAPLVHPNIIRVLDFGVEDDGTIAQTLFMPYNMSI